MRLFISKINGSENLLIEAAVFSNGVTDEILEELAPGEMIFGVSFEEILELVEAEDYKGYIEIDVN